MRTALPTHREETIAPAAAGDDPDGRTALLEAPSGPRSPLPPPGAPAGTPWRRIAVIAAVLVAVVAVVVFVLLSRSRSDIVVDSLSAPATIVAGDDLDVEVAVRNDGDAAGEYEVTLLVDEVPAADATVEVDAGAQVTVTLTVADLSTGRHELTLQDHPDLRDAVRVLEPASFRIDELVVTPERVDLAIDPVVTVDVAFTNVGEAPGTHELRLTMDGRPVATTEVSLGAGETGQQAFTVTMDTPGHPVLAVDDATAEVWVLAPPELEVGSVLVSPNPADLSIDDVVTVTVAASNIGESDGTFVLELTHDGTIVESRDVGLAAGQTIEEQFTITLARPGLQLVSVNGVEALLDVNRIARPGDGEVILDELPGGPNRLVIENRRGEDVYVVLTASGVGQPPLFGVYVHAESTRSVGGIPSGTYATYFVHGDAWCTHYRRFTQDADYGRFDDDSFFESTGNTYTEITLTFGSTDGWSPTSPLDPDEFPQM